MTESPLRPLAGVLRLMAELAARNDLAAVILHLNDTYQIEELPPDIPGMARIAEAVRLITGWVQSVTGEDRTLVVHSGDFLSPSFMTTRLGFAGEQMVELLNHCGVDYVTVGNHEFDVAADDLRERLAEADFGLVGTNLTPPAGFATVRPLVFWPESEPFLAITGFSGKQTIGKASRPPYNWRESNWRDALEAQLVELRARPEIGALTLLTHMDRDEDKELQDHLNKKWHKHALAFILGGHDHNIDWQEPGSRCVLCKNLSNASTMTAIVLSKSAVAAPSDWPGPSRPYSERLARTDHLLQMPEIVEQWDAGVRPVWAEPFEHILERTLEVWRRIAPNELRRDFKDAFERHLRVTATSQPHEAVERSHYLDDGAEHILMADAMWSAVDPYQYGGGGESGIFTIDWRGARDHRDRYSAAQTAVLSWVAKMEAQVGAQGRERIADFSAHLPNGRRMDARDEAVRTRSTDFGNFVADAIEIATGAELALVNSGCIRLDSEVGPEITVRDLQETFLYDGPKAVVTVKLTAAEVRAMLDHARSKSGGGGFLQVSHGTELVVSRDDPFRTALVAHMLVDDEDGYQSLLARSRGCVLAELPRRLGIEERGALVDLVVRGARAGVHYSDRSRLSGETVSDEAESAQHMFAESVDRYVMVCRTLGVQDALCASTGVRAALWELAPDPSRAVPERQLTEKRAFVRLVVLQLAISCGIQWVRRPFYDHLKRSALRYRKRTSYEAYLDKAMAYFDFHVRFQRLKDEEGQDELAEASAIANRVPTRRAEKIYPYPSDWLDTFITAMKSYVAACGAEGMAYPECRLWLAADPRRTPPPESIRLARLDVRHLLLFLVVNWGMERMRSDLSQAVGERDARSFPPTSFQADFLSALTFFDFIVPYGLLKDEETGRESA